MDANQIEQLLTRAASDARFGNRFYHDPMAAARSLGLDLSDPQLEVIRNHVARLRAQAERGDAKIATYPLPQVSGSPGGKPRPKPKEKEKKKDKNK